VPSDPYSSLSAARRLTQRYRTLWGLGIGECQDIAAQRPTILRDILAEFNRRSERCRAICPEMTSRSLATEDNRASGRQRSGTN